MVVERKFYTRIYSNLCDINFQIQFFLVDLSYFFAIQRLNFLLTITAQVLGCFE